MSNMPRLLLDVVDVHVMSVSSVRSRLVVVGREVEWRRNNNNGKGRALVGVIAKTVLNLGMDTGTDPVVPLPPPLPLHFLPSQSPHRRPPVGRDLDL